MSESLVHTIKRDYVYVNDCESSERILSFLPNWIFDYNNVAPHSALKMMSPVEFKKAKMSDHESNAKEFSPGIFDNQIVLKRENERVLLN